MDDFADQLELLLTQSIPSDASYSSEHPIEENEEATSAIVLEPAIPALVDPAIEPSSGVISSSSSVMNQLPQISSPHFNYNAPFPPLLSGENHIPALMATPFASDANQATGSPSQPRFLASSLLADMAEEHMQHVLGVCPPQEATIPPVLDLVGLEYHSRARQTNHQTVLHAFTHSYPTYLNPTGDPLDPNWEAIESYLAGHVRPGPDVDRVYKCNLCNQEFPNAQAFGGHMSSHSKNRRGQKNLAARKGQLFKKASSINSTHSPLAMKGGAMAAALLSKDQTNSINELANRTQDDISVANYEELNYIEFLDADD